jgi:hypothetical protein
MSRAKVFSRFSFHAAMHDAGLTFQRSNSNPNPTRGGYDQRTLLYFYFSNACSIHHLAPKSRIQHPTLHSPLTRVIPTVHARTIFG